MPRTCNAELARFKGSEADGSFCPEQQISTISTQANLDMTTSVSENAPTSGSKQTSEI
jgi:hypothetical protein